MPTRKYSIMSSKQTETPTISVVMPIYNGEKNLRKAIESILHQSFKNFEFIIVNDGSVDETEEITKSYDDSRVVYIKNNANLGLAKSFNIGIKAARGQFLARMDADDISAPDRFKKQLSFLKNHPDIDIVGSSVIIVDKDGNRLKKINRPLYHMDIKWQSLFSTPIFHPTVMARVNILKNNLYDESLSNSEDYELWSRLLFKTDTHFANIREPLLFYRTSGFTQKLDTTKRVLSAKNTISNIERYIPLNQLEKEVIVLSRQDRNLSLYQSFLILRIYARVARVFCQKEGLSFTRSLSIYVKLLDTSWFLIKHKIKHFNT